MRRSKKLCCDMCGGRWSRLQIILPPLPASVLEDSGSGTFIHIKTGEEYRSYLVCEECMNRKGKIIRMPFKIRGGADAENKEGDGSSKHTPKRLDNSTGISLTAWL